MVHVEFYWTTSDRNVIIKNIMLGGMATTAELYDNTNILNPELKMAWNDSYATDYNFFYIPEFKRYYFIDDVVAEPGGAARIKGSVDVLYTYLNKILNSPVILTRTYSTPNNTSTYIKDNLLPIHPKRWVDVYPFKTPVYAGTNIPVFNLATADNTSNNYVLTTM